MATLRIPAHEARAPSPRSALPIALVRHFLRLTGSTRRWLGLASTRGRLALLLVSVASIARSQPTNSSPAEEIAVLSEYVALDDCPSRRELESAVRARLVSPDAPSQPPLDARVHVDAHGTGVIAELQLTVPGDQPVTRRVVAPDCRQAVEGVALILALAIDAQLAASRRPETQAGPQPRPRPSTPTSPEPTAGIEALVSVARGIGPGTSLGVGLASRLSLRRGWPALRSSLLLYDSFAVKRAGAEVRFRHLFGTLALCGDREFPSERWQLDPCLGWELGMTFARGFADGRRVTTGQSVSEPWMAATLALWLRTSWQSAFVEVGPELRVLLRRHDYVLENPDALVYSAPWVAAGLSLGGGLRF